MENSILTTYSPISIVDSPRLTNGCSKDQERDKNTKQKDIGKKSFKNKRHKFPFLFTPKILEVLQRVIHKQV